MRRLFALLLTLCLAPSAHAGAWARMPGQVFLSYSSNISSPVSALGTGRLLLDRYDSAYAEIGLGNRLTFGLDYGRGQYTREGMAFLRYTLTRPDARWQLAVDLGAGQRQVDGLDDSDLWRVGLSLGHGFDLSPPDWIPGHLHGGWIAADAVAILDRTTGQTRWKLETTLGLHSGDRVDVILQAMVEQWPGQQVAYAVNPSLVVRFGAATSVEIGARVAFDGQTRVGLELGLWHRF